VFVRDLLNKIYGESVFAAQDTLPSRVARWFVFKPKIKIWVNFGGSCCGKYLVYFMTIWSTLRPLEIFYGHFVYFVVIWYIFPRFDILDQKKSGNTASKRDRFWSWWRNHFFHISCKILLLTRASVVK
jgi:hypothetical protein